jgi:thymine-DNA glycosylase
LMELYSIGNTNLCQRPTRSGDGLGKQEMEEGAVTLDAKIADFRPEAVVIVGKSIWETIWRVKTGRKKFDSSGFHWGWQEESLQLGRIVEGDHVVWEGARTFVATSTSGLAANLSPAEKLEIWKPIGAWMCSKRR